MVHESLQPEVPASVHHRLAYSFFIDSADRDLHVAPHLIPKKGLHKECVLTCTANDLKEHQTVTKNNPKAHTVQPEQHTAVTELDHCQSLPSSCLAAHCASSSRA